VIANLLPKLSLAMLTGGAGLAAIVALVLGGPELPEEYEGTLTITPSEVRPGEEIQVVLGDEAQDTPQAMTFTRFSFARLSDDTYLQERDRGWIAVGDRSGVAEGLGDAEPVTSYTVRIPRRAPEGTYLACDAATDRCALLDIG
jgi:hypothetical protein